MKKLKRVAIIISIIAVIYFISWQIDFSFGQQPVLGITFSEFYAKEILRLDWQKAYEAIIKDFQPKNLRLIAYWQYLESQKDNFDFFDLDWQISEAQKINANIILVLGLRVPRWPECHSPRWAKDYESGIMNQELLDYLREIVNHYKDFAAIKAWQVENEPFLTQFGECPPLDKNFLRKEIDLVKALDPSRPVMITDSGELSFWTRAAFFGEMFGTTLYRVVWNKFIGAWIYPYPPVFYTLRAWVLKSFYGVKNVIISELQAEPWARGGGSITRVEFEKQTQDFDISRLRRNLEFARKTGIKDIYLWGVEWWYWRKINGDENWWNLGKEIFVK